MGIQEKTHWSSCEHWSARRSARGSERVFDETRRYFRLQKPLKMVRERGTRWSAGRSRENRGSTLTGKRVLGEEGRGSRIRRHVHLVCERETDWYSGEEDGQSEGRSGDSSWLLSEDGADGGLLRVVLRLVHLESEGKAHWSVNRRRRASGSQRACRGTAPEQ